MTSKRLACAAVLLAGSTLLFAASASAQQHPSMGGHPGFHGGGHFAFTHRDFGHFTPREHGAWIGGRWNHGWHNGRLGWWWFAGGAWYFYDAPVYPYPGYVSDYYVDEDYGAPGAYWYYCSSPPGYYPYVQRCAGPWQPVTPTPPPGAGYGPPQAYQGPNGGPGPDDQPPPGYQGPNGGPGPGDQPPPGYQGPNGGPGPGDQPPPGYQGQDVGPGPGDQPPPGYQQQGPGDQLPPDGPNDQGPPGYPPPPPNGGPNGSH